MIALAPCDSEQPPVIPSHLLSFRAERGISPFVKRKGLGGCPQFNNWQCIPRSHRFARSRPLTQAKGAYIPLRIHTLSFRAASCHSERNEESPPFVKRKGARGMLACLPPTLCITFPLMYPYKRGSHALSRKVGGCRRISVVSRPNQFAANYACQATSGQLSILRASPAHIAALVRVPLRKRWGRHRPAAHPSGFPPTRE